MAEVNIKITAQDKASATINSVSKSLGGFGKQVGTVQQAVNALATGSIPGLSSSLSSLTRMISGSIGPWGLLAGAAAAAGGAMVTMAVDAANAAEELENMSAMTGLASSDLEALQKISQDAGLGTANLATSIGNLNRQLASGEGGEFARVLSALGGSIRDNSGEVKDAITVLDEMRSALLAIGSPTLRAQLANAGLGKSLRELIPLLLNSDKSLREQIEAMKDSGRVMDEVTQKNMKKLDKALDEAAADWDKLKNKIVGATVAFLDFFKVSEAPPPSMSLRELLEKMPGAPGAPGKSPLEIQAEQEARARAIASGATGKELELKLKIEDAEERMKKVHGEKQIPIAEEIASYKQQLELIQEQNKALEEQKKKIEEIDRALSRRFEQTPGELPTPPVPIAGPTLFAPGEAREQAEKLAQDLDDMRFQGFERSKKYLEDFYDYELDKSRVTQQTIEDMRQDAIREQKRQYEKMVDSIRDAAGHIFDAMLTKGESVFSSLAKFAEGVLQTMLRNVFQNAVQALAQSSGILQRLLGGAGGAGGGAAAMAGGFGGLIPLFSGGGGAAAATGGMGPFLTGGAESVTKMGFAGSAAGSALTAGGALAGQMLMMDAFRRGSAVEGLAGGAMAGASIGTMIAPGVGTAIGAGVGAIAGLITGIFGGGAQRRAEEAARRAAAIEANKFAAPETITRYGTWGGPGEFAVETDLTGQIRGIGKQPTVVNTINVQMIDARHAREAGEVIGQIVSQQILAGGGLLSDDISWAAS
jgi:hypothetical protein